MSSQLLEFQLLCHWAQHLQSRPPTRPSHLLVHLFCNLQWRPLASRQLPQPVKPWFNRLLQVSVMTESSLNHQHVFNTAWWTSSNFYHRSTTPPGSMPAPERIVTTCTSLDGHPSTSDRHLPQRQLSRRSCVSDSRATKHSKFHISSSIILDTSSEDPLSHCCAITCADRCAAAVSGKHAHGKRERTRI